MFKRKLTNFFKWGVQEGEQVVTKPPYGGGVNNDTTQTIQSGTNYKMSKVPNSQHDFSGSGMTCRQQEDLHQTITQIRVLTLNHDDHHDSTLYRLQKGWVLQLRPGPSLFGKQVNVFTNHPEDSSKVFMRTKYYKLPWLSDACNKGDDTALYVNINIILPGSFHYYFTYNEEAVKEHAKGSGYYMVDPTLTIGPEGTLLPLDCIQCQTVLSKCLGPFSQWLSRLLVSKESGYNMIHFTPIQELGISQSCYSLADQHKLNSNFSTSECTVNLDDVEILVKCMSNDWKMLSLTDIVLNHTANESPWLKEHPDATYNLVNSPHLRPSYLLDRLLYRFTLQVSEGTWEHDGVPTTITEEKHLQAIKNILKHNLLPQLKLEEFYMVNVDQTVREFKQIIGDNVPNMTLPQSMTLPQNNNNHEELSVIQDKKYQRNNCSIDIDIAVKLFNRTLSNIEDEKTRIDQCCCDLQQTLEKINKQTKIQFEDHLNRAIESSLGSIRYERLQENGPKIVEVSRKYPLVTAYFTHVGSDNMSVDEDEAATFSTAAASLMMAHNGWVMGDDALNNFALEGSNVYIRRELVAWGDSVKLRYGNKPEDSPYLWGHMKRYCEDMARVFHGLRLDNCHSTPIHVAEYMLDAARRVSPELYVIAELFTNSDVTDNIFVNRLGLNSLIREAMSADNSHDEGRLVFRYGGEPVGAFMLPPIRPLVPSIAHAMFMDITHDNPSPMETRTVWDMLPSTALVNMACCASGSTRGYDECVPHQIHVVDETRLYQSSVDGSLEKGIVNKNVGLIKCKRLLNDLHQELGNNGYNQVFVDQVTEHVVTVTRHNPVTHQSIVLAAYTSFSPPTEINDDYIRPLKIQGQLEQIIFEFIPEAINGNDACKCPAGFVKDNVFINGLDSFKVIIHEDIEAKDSLLIDLVSEQDADTTQMEYTKRFRPGSVIAFRLSLHPKAQDGINRIRSVLEHFRYQEHIAQVTTNNKDLSMIVKSLSLSDLNYVLYRCDSEEQDDGGDVYHIPNSISLPYCGLQGFISILSDIREHNDLGHPMCCNLREGDWMPEYIYNRLKINPCTEKLGLWLKVVFTSLKDIPRYLIPAYFDSVIVGVYLTLINHSWTLMSEFISGGSSFTKALALCSVQFSGIVKSSLLPPLSPQLSPPQPPNLTLNNGQQIQASVTLCAGLPHFSCGYMRNWGRDTFIALRGNLLITGRYHEARWILLAYAGTLRHGLIPNLLDGGNNARYNCRDAVWFWLHSIEQYVKHVPNGHTILKDKVSRLFPTDDVAPQKSGEHNQMLEETIHEALQRHFQGVKFRERNAGLQIDSEMNDKGFNNEIGINLETGFPFGGTIYNCGTWMDKMGSSESAGMKGKPATPRDGSAVEIVGLCKSTLRFLILMNKEYKYTFNCVERNDDNGHKIKWTYELWDKKIADNFEKHFWISDTPSSAPESYNKLINRRGIYKDTHGASYPWADLQFRPNFAIAIAVAPDMVTPHNAWRALTEAERTLLSPLGIKTLDPTDWAYRGNYDNSNDSNDPNIARGYNYHQGPEWLWPVGWLLRAQLAVAPLVGGKEQLHVTINKVKSNIARHFTHLLTDTWRSLPELTNADGAHCKDSNPAQSWSTGCLLEVLWELDQIERSLRHIDNSSN